VAAFGVSKSNASFLLMPLVLALAVGAPLAGRFLDKVGSKLVVMTGTSILTAGLFALSLFTGNWALFIVATIMIGFGLAALLGAPIRYIMLNEASVQDRAIAQAIATIFTSTGQLIGGALVGAMIASTGGTGGYSVAFGFIGVVAGVMGLLTFGLKNRAKELATTTRSSSIQVSGTVSVPGQYPQTPPQ
jgi:MFS family permease